MNCIYKLIPYIKNTNSSNELQYNLNLIRSIIDGKSDVSIKKIASLQFTNSLIV